MQFGFFTARPQSPYDFIYPIRDPASLEHAFTDVNENVFICGHSHEAWIVERQGKLGVNPGSVEAPLDGARCAQYALLAWDTGRWQAALHTAAYDLSMIRQAFIRSGFLEGGGVWARCALLKIETGRDVIRDFLDFAYTLSGQEYNRQTALSDEVWQKASAAFPWETYSQQPILNAQIR